MKSQNAGVDIEATAAVHSDVVVEDHVEADGGLVDGAVVTRTDEITLDNDATVTGTAYVPNGDDDNLICDDGSVDGIDCVDDPPVEDEADV